MNASVEGSPSERATNWSSVQLAFVLETTPYDGVYDPLSNGTGSDPCMTGGQTHPCEESNGVPFFAQHAGEIAHAIQAEHPQTIVSFALVDYFATLDGFDTVDGPEFHADVANFVNASDFGGAVNSTFVASDLGPNDTSPGSDMAVNLLHSSSITALFGTIASGTLAWGADSHHVIVWVGSTAPRDPAYLQNYSVSASEYALNGSPPSELSAGCEPSFDFAGATSPECEGWVSSQRAELPSDSIASLAGNSSSCTDSLGGSCTIDTVDLWTTSTDPSSPGWPSGRPGGGADGPIVENDTAGVIAAGCDLATATGGSWEGPANATCDGVHGTLAFSGVGATLEESGTLFHALSNVSLGPMPLAGLVGGPERPFFEYVPFGNVHVDPSKGINVRCTLGDGIPWQGPGNCRPNPEVLNGSNGFHYFGWNWSTGPDQNAMHPGDDWVVQFWIYAVAPPYSVVPVDACVTLACKIGGSSAVQGQYTSATYTSTSNASPLTTSWPGQWITVEISAPLTIAIQAIPAIGWIGHPVTFVADVAGADPPYAVSWDFGDGGSTENGTTVARTFIQAGPWEVEATVHDNASREASTYLPFTVVPQLGFTLSVAESETGPPLMMILTSNASGGMTPYTYSWDFGDGVTGHGKGGTVTHEYPQAGNFTANVSVQDLSGQSVDRTVVVRVPTHPLSAGAIVAASEASCPSPLPAERFRIPVSGGVAPYQYNWSFGDSSGPGASTEPCPPVRFQRVVTRSPYPSMTRVAVTHSPRSPFPSSMRSAHLRLPPPLFGSPTSRRSWRFSGRCWPSYRSMWSSGGYANPAEPRGPGGGDRGARGDLRVDLIRREHGARCERVGRAGRAPNSRSPSDPPERGGVGAIRAQGTPRRTGRSPVPTGRSPGSGLRGVGRRRDGLKGCSASRRQPSPASSVR